MNIALIAHDAKKELMVQFCIAYCGVLSRHNLCATGTTGKMVTEATGLKIQRFLSGAQGGVMHTIFHLQRILQQVKFLFMVWNVEI